MKRCHFCHRQTTRFRMIVDPFSLRVLSCLPCAVRFDR